MGMDMKMWIDVKWDIRDVAKFLEKKYGKKTKFHPINDVIPGVYRISFEGESYWIFVGLASWTPVGTVTYLSMRLALGDEDWSEKHRDIFRSIAKMFGGVFNPDDYDNTWEVFNGKFEENWDSEIRQAAFEGIESDDDNALSVFVRKKKDEWNAEQRALKKGLSRYE